MAWMTCECGTVLDRSQRKVHLKSLQHYKWLRIKLTGEWIDFTVSFTAVKFTACLRYGDKLAAV
jgi:hypothetical protein